jgi:Transposase
MPVSVQFRNTVPGATDMAIVPVYVGLDYHSDTSRVCVMDVDGVVLVNRNVANDPGAVRDLVRSHDGLVRGVAIEACGGAADLATKLIEQTEWIVRMAHPSAVDRLKKGPDKTDHTDAWHLANLLRVGYLPEVWLADDQTRQLRRLVRYRAGLVEQKKNIKLRIGALLREERIENTCGSKPWCKPWASASKSCGVQHFEQVGGIEGTVQAFVFGAAFVRGLLAQQADGQTADGGEVGSAVAVLLAALIFAEDDIEHPVLAVFDRPMATDGLGEKLRLRRVAADIQPRLPRLLIADHAAGNRHGERAEIFPRRTLRMVFRNLDDVASALVGATVTGLGRLMHRVFLAHEVRLHA